MSDNTFANLYPGLVLTNGLTRVRIVAVLEGDREVEYDMIDDAGRTIRSHVEAQEAWDLDASKWEKEND